MVAVIVRTNMTDFSWLQNCAIDKDDRFITKSVVKVLLSSGVHLRRLKPTLPSPTRKLRCCGAQLLPWSATLADFGLFLR